MRKHPKLDLVGFGDAASRLQGSQAGELADIVHAANPACRVLKATDRDYGWETGERGLVLVVKWSVGGGHEAQRLRRDLLVGAAKDPSLRAAAETLAARDEAAQKQRSVEATPKPRRYELTPAR